MTLELKNPHISLVPRSLEEWTERLRDEEMPIFSRTVRKLNAAIENQNAGVQDLCHIILTDPPLTAKLLKLSNTPNYNPSRQKLATISRAITLIGVNITRELALACSFIETILTSNNTRQVLKEIARALHGAVQAKSFAVATNDPQPEEVFIAALLQNIGHIAFWCFDEAYGEEILRLINEENMSPDKAEREVLGFRLKQLGSMLSKTWRLGGLIDEAFSNTKPSRRMELVQYGCEIARLSETGWDTPEFQRCQTKLIALTGKNAQELQALLKFNAESAIKLAGQFGAPQASEYIPIKQMSAPAPQPAVSVENIEKVTLIQIMQDLTNILSGEIELDLLFEVVIEGIYRALNMDRVLLARLTPDRKTLLERSSLGWPSRESRGLIQISLEEDIENAFSTVLEKNEHLWIRQGDSFQSLFTPAIQAKLGNQECCIAPIIQNKRSIGILYADRAKSKAPITQEVFDGFKHITQQANIGIKLYRAQNLG